MLKIVLHFKGYSRRSAKIAAVDAARLIVFIAPGEEVTIGLGEI